VRPKYQVFISSTFLDLEGARSKVTWELLKAGHIPVGMENFSAADERGWRTIQRTIDTSDYYVLLIGGRYGTFDESIGMSWTEREYRYAKEKGVPVLAFIRDAAHITADKVDRGKAAEHLEAFVKTVRGAHLCEKWTTEEDLCSRVSQAVRKAIEDAELDGTPRPGWYRGDQLPSLATVDELAVLSLENRKLRAQVAAFARPEGVVLEILDAAGKAQGDIEVAQPRYEVYAEDSELFAHRRVSGRFVQVADLVSRTYWLELKMRNSGDKVARNALIDFDVDGADWIVLTRDTAQSLEGRPDEEPQTATSPNEHVYVDQRTRREGGTRVRQRIKHIAVSAVETLIPMGLRGAIGADGQLRFTVKYRALNEDGESKEGSFTIVVSCTQTRVTPRQLRETLEQGTGERRGLPLIDER
jgi:hypothetical protein